MLDIKWIRDNPEALDRALAARRAPPQAAELIRLDEERRAQIGQLQALQERRNAASKEIGKAKAAKDEALAQRLMAEVATLKEALQRGEEQERLLDGALRDALAIVPNVPAADVPVGADEHANARFREWGEPRKSNAAREHFELGEALGLMDFEAAAKLSGSRFVVLRGDLARLERALGQFMLDLHTEEHGYTEVQPPLLVRDDAAFGTAQLPKFADDLFKTERSFDLSDFEEEKIQDAEAYLLRARKDLQQFAGISTEVLRRLSDGDVKRIRIQARHSARRAGLPPGPNRDLWLIPTAEVPLTNLVRQSILEEAALPLRFTALTPCFRSEAGAAGRDTRGMLRQHQFNKVELVSIVEPERSPEEHERMLGAAETVLKRLELPYRVMTLSTGDMGFAAQKTWDIEVWLPGQGTYREISSCSNCGDFQARRMEARYRPKEGKGTRLVHTLNGSGVAVGRALIAVMETYQNEDGSITIPSALRPYMRGVQRIGGA